MRVCFLYVLKSTVAVWLGGYSGAATRTSLSLGENGWPAYLRKFILVCHVSVIQHSHSTETCTQYSRSPHSTLYERRNLNPSDHWPEAVYVALPNSARAT